MSESLQSELLAILADSISSGEGGFVEQVLADRLDEIEHPLGAFFRAWAGGGYRRGGRSGWVICHGRISDRLTIRFSAVESAEPGTVEVGVMVEVRGDAGEVRGDAGEPWRVQEWLADVPVEVGRSLADIIPAADRREASNRVRTISGLVARAGSDPGWMRHAVETATAVGLGR